MVMLPFLRFCVLLSVWLFLIIKRVKREKFSPRSRKCISVGYLTGKKGWKLYDLETGDIFVSRDVQFHENTYPYASSTPNEPYPTLPDSDPLSFPFLADDIEAQPTEPRNIEPPQQETQPTQKNPHPYLRTGSPT